MAGLGAVSCQPSALKDMNISNFEHFVVLLVFALAFRLGVRYWTFFVAAIVAVEIDQAISYAHPWWLWFGQVDTILDIVFGLMGVWLAKIITNNLTHGGTS